MDTCSNIPKSLLLKIDEAAQKYRSIPADALISSITIQPIRGWREFLGVVALGPHTV